jgi:hypothetical protein
MLSNLCASTSASRRLLRETGTEVIRAWQTFLGNEWDNKGESRGEGGNGLVIEARPIGQKQFYQERAGCKSFLPEYITSHN